jgi:hypothetical protein
LIASAELIVVMADGQELPVTASVGRPYRADTGEWRCPVQLAGLYGPFPDMAGEDALQALCMAASLLRALLEDVVEKGGQLLHAAGRSAYDLDATFGRVG